jgi:hypothetical protein
MNPLGANDKTLSNSWDNDYILLNTDRWTSPQMNPPICKTEKTCPVCPMLSSNVVSLREFDNSTKLMNPDSINIEFIKKKLNM